MAQQDVTAYYDDLSQEYDQDRFGNSYGRYLHRIEERWLKQYLPNEKPYLDLGCGTGRLTQPAKYGVDVSKGMLDVAKQKFPNKTFYTGELAEVELPEPVSAIYSFHVFMHLPKEKFKSILPEVHKRLKPGGRFIVDVPNALRRKKIGYDKAGWHGNTAYYLNEIVELEKEGFKIVSVRGILMFPIHRVPIFMRNFFLPFDKLLGRTFLKKYASYFFIVLEKT